MKHSLPQFPASRPRRLRRDAFTRALVREHRLDASDLIFPVFVLSGAGHAEDVLAAAVDLIDKRPAVAKSLVRAHGRATRYIAEHPEEAVAVAVKYTGMNEEVARRALGHVAYVETPSVAGEEEYVRFLDARGVIKVEDAPAFTRGFIDLSTREAAAR